MNETKYTVDDFLRDVGPERASQPFILPTADERIADLQRQLAVVQDKLNTERLEVISAIARKEAAMRLESIQRDRADQAKAALTAAQAEIAATKREAFKAGFLAAPDPEAETFRWVFDGFNMAADREESAWTAYRSLASPARTEPTT